MAASPLADECRGCSYRQSSVSFFPDTRAPFNTVVTMFPKAWLSFHLLLLKMNPLIPVQPDPLVTGASFFPCSSPSSLLAVLPC